MTRNITWAAAAVIAACLHTAAWSQSGQTGSGSAGASGSASGTSNTQSTAGQGSTSSAAGQAGTSSAVGRGGTGQFQNQSNVPGQRQFGTARQPGFNFNAPARTPWFTDPGARRQLNLANDQFNRLNQAYMDAWNRYNRGATGLGNNLTEQQRAAQLQQLEARFNQEFNQSLDSTFTDPRLRQRYDQLNRQYQGFSTFNDPMVRQQLNLTPAQQRQLRRLENAWRQRLQQLRRAGNDNAQLTNEQWMQLQQQNAQQISSVLTPQQRQVWGQLVGEPYIFPRNVFISDPNNPQGGTPPYPGGYPDYGENAPYGAQNRAQTGEQRSQSSQQSPTRR